MTTTPDPKTVRELARKFLLDDGLTADELGYVVYSHTGYGVGHEEFQAWRDAIDADVQEATVTKVASWPDEQSQNERDAQLADLATELDAANDNANEIADRAGKYREEIMRLRAERDEARELACVSLDILKNVSDEPMRELYGVDDFGEMPEWFTGYGKPSTGALDAHNANGGE